MVARNVKRKAYKRTKAEIVELFNAYLEKVPGAIHNYPAHLFDAYLLAKE